MSDAPNKKTILFAPLGQTPNSIIGDSSDLQGFQTINAVSVNNALSILEKQAVDFIFLDIESMPRQEIDFVNYIKSNSPHTEIIILCTINELEDATRALHNGASFYLVKPIKSGDIKTIINKLSVKADRREEFIILEQRILSDLMAQSPAMQKILKLAIKIAPTS